MSSKKILTQIYLEPGQRAALRKQARANGTRMAEEVRRSVDAYLAGMSNDELELLDAATLAASKQLAAMSADLDHINARLAQTMNEIARLRKHHAVAARAK